MPGLQDEIRGKRKEEKEGCELGTERNRVKKMTEN